MLNNDKAINMPDTYFKKRKRVRPLGIYPHADSFIDTPGIANRPELRAIMDPRVLGSRCGWKCLSIRPISIVHQRSAVVQARISPVPVRITAPPTKLVVPTLHQTKPVLPLLIKWPTDMRSRGVKHQKPKVYPSNPAVLTITRTQQKGKSTLTPSPIPASVPSTLPRRVTPPPKPFTGVKISSPPRLKFRKIHKLASPLPTTKLEPQTFQETAPVSIEWEPQFASGSDFKFSGQDHPSPLTYESVADASKASSGPTTINIHLNPQVTTV